MRRPRACAARCRWLVGPGSWDVRARVERFDEPALLLLLRDDARHGYDLADALGVAAAGAIRRLGPARSNWHVVSALTGTLLLAP